MLSTAAFGSCDKLKTIKLNKGLKIIKSGAFNECTSLKKIRIPNSVTKIEKRAFVGCTNLKKAFVSKKTKVEKNAFPKTCKIIRK